MQIRFAGAVIVASLALASVGQAHAEEIWVAPTNQQDVGGLGIASNGLWPVTAAGVVRLALAVPNDLQTFQNAKVVLIPHGPGGSATLYVYVCAAKQSDLVGAACAGPFPHAFTGVTNRLQEVDISADLAPRLGAAGLNYLAVLAYTTPTTTTDHIVGMRFAYVGAPGPEGPAGPTGPQGPKGDTGVQGPPGTIASFDALHALPCTLGGQTGSTEVSYAADTGVATLRCVVPPPSGGPLVDIVLLIDTTGTMAGEISNLKSGLNTMTSSIRALYPNSAFAIARFADFPIAPYGSATSGDLPFQLAQPLTMDLPSVQTGINSLFANGGGDQPESGTSALVAAASGISLSWPGGSTPASSVGFRPGSKRIVVVVTDADFHNNFTNADPYSFAAHSFADAVSALNANGIKTTGVFTGVTVGLANLDAYAVATGAVVPPRAFGTPVSAARCLAPHVLRTQADYARWSSSPMRTGSA